MTNPPAAILSGTKLAYDFTPKLKKQAKALQQAGISPKLATVLIGDNPASYAYVGRKLQRTKEVGIEGALHHLPESTTQAQLLALIQSLNQDDSIHGILIQLPLPSHLDTEAALLALCPAKDVDGLHPSNLQATLTTPSNAHPIPCTALACIRLLEASKATFSGSTAIVIGRSMLVGRPLGMLLLQQHCTLIQAHSRTQNLKALCQSAQIVVAAVGVPKLVKPDWIQPGATVIDVGITRIEDSSKPKGFALVGDVADAKHSQAACYTPVPGGVGPMTVTCLMENLLALAAKARPKH